MPCRIAFVLPSFAGGGAERVVLTLARGLPAERFDIHIVVLDGTGPLQGEVPDGIPVHDLGHARLWRALPALGICLRRLRPQVVVPTIVHLNLAVLGLRPCLGRGTRIYARESNTPSRSLESLSRPALFRWGCRRLYPRADGILCNARVVAGELARDFRVPRDRIHLIDNPVDTMRLRDAAAPARRTPGPGPRFVAAGRLTHQKGFDRLIDAMAHAGPESRLTILGQGPEREPLGRCVAALGLEGRVTLAGYESVPWPHYAGADAFLLPSRWEGMPNAALEALACGTPVIATPEAGGIAEVAANATAGAVTVVPIGMEFKAAMEAIPPTPANGPRESLLPHRFELATVAQGLGALLEG
jgi:glycosyltransferase involved in cell wall biosynthesis